MTTLLPHVSAVASSTARSCRPSPLKSPGPRASGEAPAGDESGCRELFRGLKEPSPCPSSITTLLPHVSAVPSSTARSSRPSPLKSPDTRASGEAPTAPDDGGRETLQKLGTVRLSRHSRVGLTGGIRRKEVQRLACLERATVRSRRRPELRLIGKLRRGMDSARQAPPPRCRRITTAKRARATQLNGN